MSMKHRALALTMLLAACNAANAPAPAEPASSHPPAASLPDALLNDLQRVGQTNALAAGQEARIHFGCTLEGERFECIAAAGKLGPKMRDRVVQALDAERIKSSPKQAVSVGCEKRAGVWSCRVTYGARPGSKGIGEGFVTE